MPFFFVLFTYKDGGCCAGEISTSTSMNKFLIAIDETAYANAQYDVWCSIGNLELVGKTRCILYLFPAAAGVSRRASWEVDEAFEIISGPESGA